MIGNVRGTNGSGKSTTMRLLAEHLGGWEPIFSALDPGVKKPMGYTTQRSDVVIVGRYETDCGGCDTIKTQDEICARVRHFHQHHSHVMFEGVLVSDIYTRYRDLARELAPFSMMFLDTPLEVCVERVRARRAAKGNDKPFDPTLLTHKWHNCRRFFDKAVADNLNPVWLDWERPLEHLLTITGIS